MKKKYTAPALEAHATDITQAILLPTSGTAASSSHPVEVEEEDQTVSAPVWGAEW